MKDIKIIEIMELFDEGEVTTADQIDRPQKALDREMFQDASERFNKAQGGRIGFRKGGFEKMNLERRLKAYNELKETYGKETIEDAFKNQFGTSFENIADKKEYKGRTVTNIIDGFKKKIKGINRSSVTSPIYNEKTGHIYKTSNRFGTFYSKNPPKNQFTGKLLTENMDLVNAIKEDAKTMSQIEVEKKYKINKKTLKKIKDKYDIEFRQSYKAVPKKSIPYEDRYTAEEKSELYKRRKSRETEEDRIKARERDKKYRDKVFKEYKMEPSSRTSYDDLWKDIARSANEGDRIKLLEGPKYSSGASYKDFQSRVFLDTKTNERFTYDTLKNYLDSGKLEGVTYDSVIEPYELKNKIAKSGLREEIQQAYFGDKYKPPSKFRAQNTFHVHHIGGVAADPFSVQLTFADENLGLVSNKKFNTEWAKLIERNAPLSERKAYLKFVKSKTGENIAQTLEFPEVGKTRTYGEIGTDMQKLLSDKKFKGLNIEKLLASFSANPKCRAKFSGGGRIGYATGPADLSECAISGRNRLEKVIKGGVKLGTQEGALATQILRAGRSLGSAFTLSGLFGPAAIAFTAAAEAGIVGYDMLTTGKTFKETIGDSLFNYALGEKTKIDPDKELIKRFGTLEGMTDDKLAGIKNVLKQTNTLNTILKQDLKVGNLEDQVKAFREQPKDQFMLPDDEMSQTDTAIRTEQALKDEQKNLENLLINYRSQPPVGLSMEDTILGDMASGKFQDTKKDLDEAIKAAEIQKLESKGPVFMGKVFPKFEEGRQEKLLNLRAVDNPAVAFSQQNQFMYPFGLAGGGIAKLAGIDEGPQTVSMNPDSQGLRSLKNRVKNI